MFRASAGVVVTDTAMSTEARQNGSSAIKPHKCLIFHHFPDGKTW